MPDAPRESSSSPPQHHESIKDTLISITIAFALAFVFRGFVIEAFVIPTGSMAPTLMGAHMRFDGSETGHSWPVGPRDVGPRGSEDYLALQGNPAQRKPPISVNDPMSGQSIVRENVRLKSGDRILVQKFLYGIREPERFDVVVFNNPTQPSQRYIKRLVGKAGEQVALVDGDVFFRPGNIVTSVVTDAAEAWSQGDWKIARKPMLVQHSVWQPVFDSAFTPGASGLMPDSFRSPWQPAAGQQSDWNMAGPSYTFEGGSGRQGGLVFDQTQLRFREPRLLWEVNDYYPYDQTLGGPQYLFPVSDVRIRAGIECERGEGTSIAIVLTCRGHEFRMTVSCMRGIASVVLEQRTPMGTPDGGGASPLSAWTEVARGTSPHGLRAEGGVTDIEFIHVDQALIAVVDGDIVARYEYDWTPAQRIAYVTGRSVREHVDASRAGKNSLGVPEAYRFGRPNISFQIESPGKVTMHRVGVDRDLYYQPKLNGGKYEFGRAVTPSRVVTLNANQFFVCGDNSPSSLDSRFLDPADPWVRELIDDAEGIVPRDLLIGRAFFVYFPSVLNDSPLKFLPDFGRMRFFW